MLAERVRAGALVHFGGEATGLASRFPWPVLGHTHKGARRAKGSSASNTEKEA